MILAGLQLACGAKKNTLEIGEPSSKETVVDP